MSRNDTYLSLCLEQASLSPLHYRHGCIVVRGGKIIGKGYNDYRSGYNGGAQSTGQLRSTVAPKAIATNGQKPKNNRAPVINGHETMTGKKLSKNYVAFDSENHPVGTGGGSLANTPLSMHSEMMAINSALSLSSAIACQGTARSTQWLQKPCFKLPSRSKRQSRLQQLKAYADAVCPDEEERETTSERRGKSHDYRKGYYNGEEEEEEEKDESKLQNTGSNYVHHHAQINYLNFQKANSEVPRQLTSDDNEKHRNQYLYGIQNTNQYRQHGSHQKDQSIEHLQQQHRSSALVVPQNRILSKSHQVAERMKDSRLNGADLYVARLGRVGKIDHFDCGCQRDKPEIAHNARRLEDGKEQTAVTVQPLTGSLHDELRFPSPSKPKAEPVKGETSQQVTATYSRPCYRCISYMHSAGIKRVFWTNTKGEWEGGKVRELVDALDGPTSPGGEGSTGVSGTGSVYVTKSEVLLLKGLR